MRISFAAANKQAHPVVSFRGIRNFNGNEDFIRFSRKDKEKVVVVVVMGPTGTGKSRLAIDLATQFPAEIVNSDKMQVYKGLDIVTNKVTDEERRGIPHREDKVKVGVMGATGIRKSTLSIDLATQFPAEIVNSDKMQVYKGLDIVTNKVTDKERRGIPHHLLGVVDPKVEFSATDFGHHSSLAVEAIERRERLPIIAGGSNSYIKALVSDDIEFQTKYDCCFLWVDVSLPVLHSFVSDRFDRMVEIGLVDEIRGIFYPNAEMDQFFREEPNVDDETKALRLKRPLRKSSTNIWEKSVAGPSTQLLISLTATVVAGTTITHVLLKRLLPQFIH